MSDFSTLNGRIADQQIRERIAAKQASKIPGRTRPHGRHAFAARLHHLANRIDG
jgi:hypothetical protein